MTQRARILIIGTIAFLLWAVIATATTVHYYQQYASVSRKYEEYYQKYVYIRGSVLQVSVTLNYGNGTSITKQVYLSPNTTVLDALKTVAEVKTTYWVAYSSFLVDAINGVVNNANNNNRWWVYSVNGEHALVSADQYRLYDGDHIEWKYEQY